MVGRWGRLTLTLTPTLTPTLTLALALTLTLNLTLPLALTRCENLGAVESICTCPSVMTHANMLQEDRLKVGITDGFVRISCGIEDADDLIASLKQSLDAL